MPKLALTVNKESFTLNYPSQFAGVNFIGQQHFPFDIDDVARQFFLTNQELFTAEAETELTAIKETDFGYKITMGEQRYFLAVDELLVDIYPEQLSFRAPLYSVDSKSQAPLITENGHPPKYFAECQTEESKETEEAPFTVEIHPHDDLTAMLKAMNEIAYVNKLDLAEVDTLYDAYQQFGSEKFDDDEKTLYEKIKKLNLFHAALKEPSFVPLVNYQIEQQQAAKIVRDARKQALSELRSKLINIASELLTNNTWGFKEKDSFADQAMRKALFDAQKHNSPSEQYLALLQRYSINALLHLIFSELYKKQTFSFDNVTNTVLKLTSAHPELATAALNWNALLVQAETKAETARCLNAEQALSVVNSLKSEANEPLKQDDINKLCHDVATSLTHHPIRLLAESDNIDLASNHEHQKLLLNMLHTFMSQTIVRLQSKWFASTKLAAAEKVKALLVKKFEQEEPLDELQMQKLVRVCLVVASHRRIPLNPFRPKSKAEFTKLLRLRKSEMPKPLNAACTEEADESWRSCAAINSKKTLVI